MMKLATLCYVKANGRTLMLHRVKKQNDMHAGKWNGLGGKFLPGETPEQCVIREVQEESGLTLHKPLLRGVLTFPAFSKGEDWYAFVFVAHEFTGELIDSDEGVLRWIDDADLLNLNLWEGDKIFLKWLDQNSFFSGQFIYDAGQLRAYNAVFYEPQRVLHEEFHVQAEPQVTPPLPAPPAFKPVYQPADDTYCWMCNGPVVKRHCKIVCQLCGFTRDCGDP
ncbi:MAG: 8-oxo-dGTP diphosphatase [Caldilineaceae bacterium]